VLMTLEPLLGPFGASAALKEPLVSSSLRYSKGGASNHRRSRRLMRPDCGSACFCFMQATTIAEPVQQYRQGISDRLCDFVFHAHAMDTPNRKSLEMAEPNPSSRQGKPPSLEVPSGFGTLSCQNSEYVYGRKSPFLLIGSHGGSLAIDTTEAGNCHVNCIRGTDTSQLRSLSIY
jgi:hypothetical protein